MCGDDGEEDCRLTSHPKMTKEQKRQVAQPYVITSLQIPRKKRGGEWGAKGEREDLRAWRARPTCWRHVSTTAIAACRCFRSMNLCKCARVHVSHALSIR